MREFLHLDKRAPLNSLNGPLSLQARVLRDRHRLARLPSRARLGQNRGRRNERRARPDPRTRRRGGAARAFVHRSHSGHYGLVNSESGYQNLRRFLFGDTRVLIETTDVTVSLPRELDRAKERGKKIRASYHVDTIFSVRGVAVDLHRRCYDERSAIFRTYEQLAQGPTTLFTAFLTSGARVKRNRRSLGFALSLQVRVPKYEVDGRLFDDYYEGGVLFVDKLNVEVTPRPGGHEPDQARLGQSHARPRAIPPTGTGAEGGRVDRNHSVRWFPQPAPGYPGPYPTDRHPVERARAVERDCAVARLQEVVSRRPPRMR